MIIRIGVLIGAAMLCAAGAANAHHSFAAEYDADKPFTMSGVVAAVEWTNPHVYFSLDVKGDKGAVTRWRFEGFPPNMLVRQGWQRDVTVKVGDQVTVTGWLARNDANLGALRNVTLPDGRKLAAGPPAGTGGR
jgi:hypothetical protein